MLLNSEITFWSEDDSYNPKTHEYGETKKVAVFMANVTDLGTNRSVELFGTYDSTAKVIRMVEPINEPWSYLTIGDSQIHYILQTARKPLQNATLIVGETNG